MRLQKPTRRRSRFKRIVLGIIALGLASIVVCLVVIIFWPDIAAQNIDHLRDIIGDAPVAQLEEIVFSIKDHTQQLEYSLGLVKPAAPWAVSTEQVEMIQPTSTHYRVFNEVPTNQPKLTKTPLNTVAPSATFT